MGQPHFTVFRVVCVLSLVAAAIWMFMGGPAPAHDVPDILLDTPPWLIGIVLLVAAILAAVLSAETIEDAIARFLGERPDD